MNKACCHRIWWIFIAILFLNNGLALAQDEDDALKKVVIFEKEAKLELPTAVRNYEKISPEKQENASTAQEYDFSEVDLRLPKLDMKIKVPTIKPPELKKLYGNYVKAGFGNYVSPYLEGVFNNKRSDVYDYGFHLRHLSSRRGPSPYGVNAATSENALSGHGTYYTGNIALKGRMSYNRNMYNYYGYNPELAVSDDTTKQVYNLFSIQTGIENTDKDAAVNYDANVEYYMFGDRFNVKENEFIGRFNARYNIDDSKAISLGGLYSSSKREDIESITRNYFSFRPSFLFKKGIFDLRAGFNSAYSDDTLNGQNNFHIYPDFNLDVHFIPGRLTFFGGITGDLERNVLRNMVSENPFLGQQITLSHTNKSFEAYAGAKGNVLEKLNYKGRVSFATYRNMYFFVNSFSDSSRFDVIYDRGNVNVLNLTAEASYDVTEKFRIGLNTNYFNYNVNIERAWHKPSFINTLSASYNLHQKIYFNADIYYISGITGKNFTTGNIVELPAIADLNFKIDYKFSPAFSAFLEFNNILSRNYQRYLYYPVRGANILGGLSYTF